LSAALSGRTADPRKDRGPTRPSLRLRANRSFPRGSCRPCLTDYGTAGSPGTRWRRGCMAGTMRRAEQRKSPSCLRDRGTLTGGGFPATHDSRSARPRCALAPDRFDVCHRAPALPTSACRPAQPTHAGRGSRAWRRSGLRPQPLGGLSHGPAQHVLQAPRPARDRARLEHPRGPAADAHARPEARIDPSRSALHVDSCAHRPSM